MDTYKQPDWAKDEPGMLATVSNRLVQLKDRCPFCRNQSLTGLREAGTNAVVYVHCTNYDCDYHEDY